MSDFEWQDASYGMSMHYLARVGPFLAEVYETMEGRWRGAVSQVGEPEYVTKDSFIEATDWCMNYCLRKLEAWTTRTRLMIDSGPVDRDTRVV